MSKFNIMETTVAKVQAAYLDGTLTCRELCEDCLLYTYPSPRDCS